MTILDAFLPVAADEPPLSAATLAPPGGPVTAPGPAPSWDQRSSYRGGAWNPKPRAGVLLDDDIWCGFAEYLRRTDP